MRRRAGSASIESHRDRVDTEAASSSVVYAWKDGREPAGRTEQNRTKQLEIENLHLKQLVGSLSLEKKVLLEMLERRGEPDSKKS